VSEEEHTPGAAPGLSPPPAVPGARAPLPPDLGRDTDHEPVDGYDTAAGRDEEPGGGEHAELERLRTEVAELRARAQKQGAAPPPRPAGAARGRWRTPVAAVAVVLGCLLAPVSVLGVWAANQVSNTDRYVANMAPLIHDPAIQKALSARITDEITSQVDVQALVTQASGQLAGDHLPRVSALLQNFSGPIASAVNGLIATTVARAVASPAMAALWVQANRAAHTGIVKVLSGEGNGNLTVVNGKVVLNLGPLITQVKQQLVARGLTVADKIPAVNPTFPLFAAPNLAKAQTGYRLLLDLKWVLPFLSLALLAAGVWAGRNRRRWLTGAALGLSASMLVLAIALLIARAVYLNSVPQTVLPGDAAAVLYDTLVRFIKQGLRVLLVAGLVVAAGAFLTGPAAAAVGTRRAVRGGIGWARDRGARAGLRTGPAGTWTAAHIRLLRIGAVALAVLIFVFWGEPTAVFVIVLVLLLLVVLGLIELLGGGTRPAAASAK
jgi:hypothetical protein